MIVQTILEIQANVYPFDEVISQGSKGMVEELDFFQSKEKLTQRKNQLKKHMKSIQSNLIIKLQKIFEEDLCLHYIYEHVQFSLSNYIKSQLSRDEYDKFKDMSAKLLFRKLTNDINAIAAELSKLRIEAQFSYEKLGVQQNKVKLFIGSHFQVGRKSQLLLKDYYRPRKEIALKILEQEIFRIINDTIDTPNFVIRGNRLLFGNNRRQPSILNYNIAPSVYSESNENSFCLNDTYFNCQTKDSQVNNTKQKERRYSQTKIDANQWKRLGKDQQKLRNTQSPAFINNANFDNKSKMGASKHFDDSINSQDDNFDGKSYCHSKSIRIELQKNKNKRHRKDSYKVKIITTHEYQMDDINTNDIFKKCNISDSQSLESNRPKNQNKHKSPHKKQFEEKVQKAAQKARQILNGYLHRRRNSRK